MKVDVSKVRIVVRITEPKELDLMTAKVLTGINWKMDKINDSLNDMIEHYNEVRDFIEITVEDKEDTN